MDSTTHTSTQDGQITLEAILNPDNLLQALRRVEKNAGAAGIDGMKTNQVREYIVTHPGHLSTMIKEGKYRPSPVLRVTIPKQEKGKFRHLGIPTVIDRVIQQAIAQVLNNVFDREFSMSSCGFRPLRGAHDAIFQTVGHLDKGYKWAVDMDLEKYFDTVNHERLMGKLRAKIKDSRVLSIIHRILKAKVSTENGLEEVTCGVPQGGPLSPLLANIYLDELDKELEKRGHRFTRYADDLIILCKSKRSAQRTMSNTRKYIEGKMKLKVNEAKTNVSYITKGVKFLGYGFASKRLANGQRIVPSIHKASRQRFKDMVRKILSRSRGKGLEAIKEELKTKLRGWCAYFKLADERSWVKDTDEWIRRRIRQLLWKLWKTISRRMRALKSLGCKHERAYMWSMSRKGYWRIANSPILKRTLKNDVLKAARWTWIKLVHHPLEWK